MPRASATSKERLIPAVEDMTRAVNTLNALANKQRLQVLCLLAQNSEMTVGQLNDQLALSQSALSQHLAKLRSQGYVVFRKEGLNVYYRIGNDDVLEILDLLHKLYCSSAV